MNILTQNYANMLENLIKKEVISKINKLSFNTKSTDNIFNYTNFISNVDSTFNNIAINYIKNYITMIDNNYKNSLDRKRKYHISVAHKRTILTVFGEITYKRTFYKSKLDNSSFCFIKRCLGFDKYTYFDPYIRSKLLDYAASNSYCKSAKYINT